MEKFETILALFEQSSLDFLSYDDHGLKIEMRRNSSPSQPQYQRQQENSSSSVEEKTHAASFSSTEGEQTEAENLYPMVCPTVGIFYRKPSPQEPNYVEVGDRVKKGDVLCTLEAMKVFSEVKSPVDGVIRSVALEDGVMAGQGDLLFEIELC